MRLGDKRGRIGKCRMVWSNILTCGNTREPLLYTSIRINILAWFFQVPLHLHLLKLYLVPSHFALRISLLIRGGGCITHIRVGPCCPTHSWEGRLCWKRPVSRRGTLFSKSSPLHTRCDKGKSHLHSAYNAYDIISLNFSPGLKSIS